LLAGKPVIPTAPVETCLGDRRSAFTVVATGYDFEYRSCANQFEIRCAGEDDLLYVFPQPTAEALGTIYPPEYLPFQFHELRGVVGWARDLVQGRKAKAILSLAGSDGKILDVGTGSGALVRQLARVKGSRTNIYANDFSDAILGPLKAQGFETIVGLAEHLHVPEQFQVICLIQVVEHLQNPVRVVARLTGLLAPGGHLFIETPSTEGTDSRLFRRRYWGGYHFPRHFWLFNARSLRRLLTDAGLEVAEVRYLCSPAFWIQSFHHALLDHGWFRLARFFSERDPLLLAIFTALDMVLIVLGVKTSNIRVVARKPMPNADPAPRSER
jgi:SAM-dependent methyltransferase